MEKLKAIQNYPRPTTIKELRQFFGLVNYQRRFLQHAAEILAPLNAYLQGKVTNNQKTSLSASAELAFEKIKDELANVTYLAYPKESAQLYLKLDASDVSLGAILEQVHEGKTEVIGYYSKALTSG